MRFVRSAHQDAAAAPCTPGAGRFVERSCAAPVAPQPAELERPGPLRPRVSQPQAPQEPAAQELGARTLAQAESQHAAPAAAQARPREQQPAFPEQLRSALVQAERLPAAELELRASLPAAQRLAWRLLAVARPDAAEV
jgi:hypothetical protein